MVFDWEGMNMKNYDPNICRGIHMIEITIQAWGYVGHVTTKIGGNCKGRNIIECIDFEDDYSHSQNDCNLKYDEDLDYYSALLKNENGDTLEVEESSEDFNNMIVKIEILDYAKEESEE